MSFSGKVAIVTGASSGIGASTAILFAKEAASVVLVGRNQTKLANVEAKLPKNTKFLTIRADVASEAKKIIDETVKKFGKIDILVNNAGIGRFGSLTEGKFLEAYDEIQRVNLRAVAEMTMLAIPHLVKTKGNIVNVGSGASQALAGDPRVHAYHTLKAALDHFTRGAAKELAPEGVRVNSVNPGPVDTDFFENMGFDGGMDVVKECTALKRVSSPEEIADLIAYVAGDKGRGITGSIYFNDNGYLLCN